APRVTTTRSPGQTCGQSSRAGSARARSSRIDAASFELVDHGGDDLQGVTYDAEVGALEDRGVPVPVDRDDVLGVLHSDDVLAGAADPYRNVDLGRHRLAGLADLHAVG